MFVLEIISALLLLLNKAFVYKKKTIGWIFGILGAIAATIYFYLQMILEKKGDLWIMVVYDIALLFLMIYGYLISSANKNSQRAEFLKRLGVRFKTIVVSVTLSVCIFLFVRAITADLILIQLFVAIGGLMGTLLLSFNKSVTNIIGWIVYFLTHVVVTYLMFKKDAPFFAWCQILSAIISLVALKDEIQESNGKKFAAT